MRVSDRHRLPSPPRWLRGQRRRRQRRPRSGGRGLVGPGGGVLRHPPRRLGGGAAAHAPPPRPPRRPPGLQRRAAPVSPGRGRGSGRGERGVGVWARRGGNGSGRSPRGFRPSPRRLPGAWGGIPSPGGAAERAARASGSGEPLGAVTPRRGCGPRLGFRARPSGGKRGRGAGGDRACPGAALGLAPVPLWPGSAAGPGAASSARCGRGKIKSNSGNRNSSR